MIILMEYEKLSCYHNKPCDLRFGVKKNSKSYGKSFYVCSETPACKFKQEANVSLHNCPVHKDSPITIYSFKIEEGQGCVGFHCSQGLAEWCGYRSLVDKENLEPNIKGHKETSKCSEESSDEEIDNTVYATPEAASYIMTPHQNNGLGNSSLFLSTKLENSSYQKIGDISVATVNDSMEKIGDISMATVNNSMKEIGDNIKVDQYKDVENNRKEKYDVSVEEDRRSNVSSEEERGDDISYIEDEVIDVSEEEEENDISYNKDNVSDVSEEEEENGISYNKDSVSDVSEEEEENNISYNKDSVSDVSEEDRRSNVSSEEERGDDISHIEDEAIDVSEEEEENDISYNKDNVSDVSEEEEENGISYNKDSIADVSEEEEENNISYNKDNVSDVSEEEEENNISYNKDSVSDVSEEEEENNISYNKDSVSDVSEEEEENDTSYNKDSVSDVSEEEEENDFKEDNIHYVSSDKEKKASCKESDNEEKPYNEGDSSDGRTIRSFPTVINSDSDDEPLVKSKTTPSHLDASMRVSSSGISPSVSSNVSITSNESSPFSRVSTSKSSTDSATVMVDDEDEVEEKEETFKLGFQFRKLVKQLVEHQMLLDRFGSNLPDKGENLRRQIAMIKKRMLRLRGYVPSNSEIEELLSRPGDDNQEPKKPVFAIHSQAKLLTAGAVQNLHSSISTCPSEETLAETPSGLKVDLMRHQKRALAWLQWREDQIPHGGILADDMGLGKTLSMISLIIKKNQNHSDYISRKDDGLLKCNATLVVVPLTLLKMWESEIKSKVYSGVLSVTLYHGTNRPKNPEELLHYDVVVTTYNIVGIEAGSLTETSASAKKKRQPASNTLFQIHWNRVILDEAHTIRNPKTAMSIGCCGLSSVYRWAMTGTPIQNKLEDFYSLTKFLRLSPFDDLRVWKDTIQNRSSMGLQRLRTMVSSLVLRRTKDEMEVGGVLNLPEKSVISHSVELQETERSIYNVLFHIGRSFFIQYLEKHEMNIASVDEGPSINDLLAKVPIQLQSAVHVLMRSIMKEDSTMSRGGGSFVLILLLRLRQCCCHPHLLSTALDASSLADTDLSLAMENLSLNPHHDIIPSQSELTQLSHFQMKSASSKTEVILRELRRIMDTDQPGQLPNKCIVVSQWCTMLNVLERHLQMLNISYTKVDGKVPPKLRQVNVDYFNRASADPRVMLLSLQAGGVGLTLTGANHVFITDLHWNPQLEEQASDRCHRVGQTRPVTIHRFVTVKSVEEVIQKIQERKLKLASDVLHGAKRSNKSNKGLTLDDLKQLFEI